MNKIEFFILVIVALMMIAALSLGYSVGKEAKTKEDIHDCELRCYGAIKLCSDFMDLQTKFYNAECNKTR